MTYKPINFLHKYNAEDVEGCGLEPAWTSGSETGTTLCLASRHSGWRRHPPIAYMRYHLFLVSFSFFILSLLSPFSLASKHPRKFVSCRVIVLLCVDNLLTLPVHFTNHKKCIEMSREFNGGRTRNPDIS